MSINSAYNTQPIQCEFLISGTIVIARTMDQNRHIKDYPIQRAILPAEIQNATIFKIVEYLRVHHFFLDFRNGQIGLSNADSIESRRFKYQPTEVQVPAPPPQNDPQALFNQAQAFFTNKQYNEAAFFFLKTLDFLPEVPDEFFIAEIYDHLSQSYSAFEAKESAIYYSQLSLNLKRKRLGENHFALHLNYSIIGGNYVILKDFKNALAAYLNDLNVLIHYYGKTHIQVIETYEHIAYLYEELGQFNEALLYYHEALNIKKSLSDRYTLSMAESYESMGQIFCLFNDCEQMYACFSEAREIQEKILGKNHYCIALNYNNIGFGFFKAEKYDLALIYYQHALETWLKLDPSTYLHEDFRNTVENILICSEAPSYRNVLETCAKMCDSFLGTMHPITQSIFVELYNAKALIESQ